MRKPISTTAFLMVVASEVKTSTWRAGPSFLKTLFSCSPAQCIALAVFLGTAISADAADRYVRQGATGANNGTDWINAYTSLPSSLTRGDTYYIADGTYSSYTFDDANSGSTLITIKKATVADHGTDAGWDDSYGNGQAEFGPSWRFMNGYYLIDGQVGGGPDVWGHGSDDDGSSYGFRLRTTVNSGTKLVRIGDFGSPLISNITLRHIDFSYDANNSLGYPSPDSTSSEDAIYGVGDMTNLTVSYSRFNRAGRTAILSRSNWHDITFEYTYFRDCVIGASSNMHGELWSANHVGTDSLTNVHFRHNLIRNTRSTGGLIMSGGNGIHVYGNIWYFAGGSNGLVSNWSAEPRSVNVFISNNTFISSDVGLGWTSMTVTSYNNAFYSNSDINFYGTHDYSYTDTNLGEANQQMFTGDPFVESTGATVDARLTAPTNAGSILSSPYDVDLDGLIRGEDGIWDRGASEYVSGSRPEAPIALSVN